LSTLVATDDDLVCNQPLSGSIREIGGSIERAQQIANHESPKTTKLYDRTSDQITLDEIERIVI
jgi:hypothetical protein